MGTTEQHRRRFLPVLALALAWGSPSAGGQASHTSAPSPRDVGEAIPSVQPKEGFVPDQATAVRIAEAILVPIYGEELIKSERPFRATLKEGIWTVVGTLPQRFAGGAAVVRLAKADGRILFVIHEK